ncbi:unnamed protein product [Cylindrotheca closterium]|uniref:Uncharacterized protein n=1 Tax=Cylindrotheca closterium TaxID=2856 RepID=A0AAD2CQR3_9STRA|nr:unnamed protein product [Cylindrotheca closterium]
MAFRQVLSKAILPGLEQDLSRAISKEISKVPSMVDCMVAPSVFAFEPAAVASAAAGAFGRSAQRHSRMVKVEYPAPKPGLFTI